jgi:hypothetical protein
MRVSIPKPCHENWDKMNPTEKGRFCDVCDKEVMDFSSMSNAEIADFFKTSKGPGCGNFRTDQVKNETPSWFDKLFANVHLNSVLVLSFLASLFSSSSSQAQDIIGDNSGNSVPDHSLYADSIIYHFTGNVKNKKGNPLVHAAVRIKYGERDITVGYTDSLGNYSINVPATLKETKFNIYITKYRYKENVVKSFVPTLEPLDVVMHIKKSRRSKYRRGRYVVGAYSF